MEPTKPPKPLIRVLIADDHAMVRRGMRDFLALHADLDVVAEAGDGASRTQAALLAVEHGEGDP